MRTHPLTLTDFADQARPGAWREVSPGPAPAGREVRGDIWSDAIEAALLAGNVLHIPERDAPYYLDRPIMLHSGQSLVADPEAEIRLKPDTNTCMVRNATIRAYPECPVPENAPRDRDISVEGGIWTTLFAGGAACNGNTRGAADADDSVPGAHGVFLFHGVENLAVRNVTVRHGKPFAVHLGNVVNFTVDGLRLDAHGRDGVHVDGPARDGLIRNVSGDSHDDTVALNAWDWRNYSVSFGPIADVRIERVVANPQPQKGVADTIRLLPGIKCFADGSTLACSIERITLSDIENIAEFKLYDQPNLEMPPGADRSAGMGHLRDIVFCNLRCARPALIDIHADADNIVLDGVAVDYPVQPDDVLVRVGPKSQLWQRGPDPATWRELFSPDLDCTVRGLSISGVTINGIPADDRNWCREEDRSTTP
jgi:hypothetical protein